MSGFLSQRLTNDWLHKIIHAGYSNRLVFLHEAPVLELKASRKEQMMNTFFPRVMRDWWDRKMKPDLRTKDYHAADESIAAGCLFSTPMICQETTAPVSF